MDEGLHRGSDRSWWKVVRVSGIVLCLIVSSAIAPVATANRDSDP